MQVIRRKPKEGIHLTADLPPDAQKEARSLIPTNELSISTLQQLAEVGRILIRSPIEIKMLAVEGTAPHGRASIGIEADKRIKYLWFDQYGNPERP